MNISKKYLIRIPDNISLYYSEHKRIIIFKGPRGIKSFDLPVKIIVLEQNNYIRVTRLSFTSISNNLKKKLKSIQGLTLALLKQIIFDISYIRFKKLNLVGLGYKMFQIKSNVDYKLVYFKLGYSHFIYLKIPKILKLFDLKSIQLFVLGNSYQLVSQFAACIRSYKLPDIYKGKGILYLNEKIKLKKGKRV